MSSNGESVTNAFTSQCHRIVDLRSLGLVGLTSMDHEREVNTLLAGNVLLLCEDCCECSDRLQQVLRACHVESGDVVWKLLLQFDTPLVGFPHIIGLLCFQGGDDHPRSAEAWVLSTETVDSFLEELCHFVVRDLGPVVLRPGREDGLFDLQEHHLRLVASLEDVPEEASPAKVEWRHTSQSPNSFPDSSEFVPAFLHSWKWLQGQQAVQLVLVFTSSLYPTRRNRCTFCE
mmetsp:Transcript_7900/g.11380  ORF Transcript_7900/g.11380 Transcript_7900/m.11380 type:complete len:231 (-) Transcript_7900:21-713(-)